MLDIEDAGVSTVKFIASLDSNSTVPGVFPTTESLQEPVEVVIAVGDGVADGSLGAGDVPLEDDFCRGLVLALALNFAIALGESRRFDGRSCAGAGNASSVRGGSNP